MTAIRTTILKTSLAALLAAGEIKSIECALRALLQNRNNIVADQRTAP